MGDGYIIHMNHLLLVNDTFPRLAHGLNKTHLERKDRQNWQVAQEITFLRVQDCLKKIISGHDGKPPNATVTGTLVYLEMVWHYVEIFFSPTATLVERIKYAGYVVHFLGIWRNYLFNHPARQLKIHFITKESFQHVLISCHFAVFLICYMRDCFPDVECRLDLTGSDVCESFFSVNGQWIGNRHNYSFNEMRCNVNHMVRLNCITSGSSGPQLSRAHKKQENVWHKQHPADTPCNLKLYPQPGEEITAWKQGIALARMKAKSVGMSPTYFKETDTADENENDPEQQWFFSPYGGEDDAEMANEMATEEETSIPGDEDDTAEETSSDGNSISTSDEDDISTEPLINPDELHMARNAIASALDEGEELRSQDSEQIKISPTVMVPGYGRQYKSTLVKLLNEGSELSHDRLVRVRQVQSVPGCDGAKSVETSSEHSISLFEDYAFVCNHSIAYGRLERMRKAGKTRGMIEYKQPVLFSDPTRKDVQLLFHTYEVKANVFTLETSALVEICANKVISPINLTLNDDDRLIANSIEIEAIEGEFHSNKASSSKASSGKSGSKRTTETNVRKDQADSVSSSSSNNGLMRTVVIPSDDGSSNRRSKRIKTVVSSFSDFL